jgi:hypothetical protein
MLLNELSEGDDSSSEKRRSQSIGSESESESDASRPTNLDINGILGAIIHCPPNKRPTNSTSSSSSSSSSAKTKGTYLHRTTLGNGRVVETRVLVRNQNMPVSKRQRTELNVKEDNEVHQEQEDDMSSLLEASVGIQSFQDNAQHDNGMLTIGMMVQKLMTKQSCCSPPLMAVQTNTSTISHPISPVVTPHLLGL